MIYKRKKLGKTNYKSRLEHLKSNIPRLIIRKSLKNIWSQIVEYTPTGDKVLISAHSRELNKNFKLIKRMKSVLF